MIGAPTIGSIAHLPEKQAIKAQILNFNRAIFTIAYVTTAIGFWPIAGL
jgi:hypothetical protein